VTSHIERDYLERTIATVRNHRDADNCWPQWANIFADEIERLWDETDRGKDLLHTELVEAREAFNASCRETDKFEVKVRAAEATLVAVEAEVETARKALADVRDILDAYSDDDGPGACLVALGKIGQRVYSEVTGV
jgi:hypothetical protein